MAEKKHFTTETILRAAEKMKNRKINDMKIKNPELIGTITEQQIKEAFIRASKRLDVITGRSCG